MSEPGDLDQSARDLIAAGRDGLAPNPFVAERLRRSVARVLEGAVPVRSRSRRVPVLLALGAAALGGVLYAHQRLRPGNDPATLREPAAAAKAVATAPSPTPPRAPTPDPQAPVPASLPDPKSAPRTPGRSEASPATRSQQLSAEIEFLARVNGAVNAGDGSRALTLLAEYDRKFRPSILAEERTAASVLALCAAGRKAEAGTAAERFARTWPRSPLLGRVRNSCAGTR